MANIINYLDWRGDLTLAQAPFNEVDSLVLSELVYLDFQGIVSGMDGGDTITIAQAAQAFQKSERGTYLGIFVPTQAPLLLEKMGQSARFGHMELSHFVDYIDNEHSLQFAAMTIHTGDGAMFIAYRGTDDSLAGWKEDFLISCMPEIPAQKSALLYAKTVTTQIPRKKIRLGGHSKGGNLAVYAATFVPYKMQHRILHVYSNDGPGFHHAIFDLPQHQRLEGRISTFVPASSVVGIFMQHEEDYTVIKSNQLGFLQHDGFSWEVLGSEFIHLEELSKGGQYFDQAMQSWLDALSITQREQFIESLFHILTASGAQTLGDMRTDAHKTALAMVRATVDMDKPTRDALLHAVGLLFRTNLQVRREGWHPWWKREE
ncbi:DUF2974 domain-containing protein [Bengtsoniella intestinalis]|uniref:Mbeg1-like protein n=1 Tax=Bengtsoniella intestinalis TaxID=3073143 RepID=UPI00391FA957